MQSRLINDSSKLWILWGIASPLLTFLGFLSGVLISPYITALFEFLPPAFFGLWVLDRENFKTNIYKLIFLLTVLAGLIFFLGQLAMIVAPFIILFVASKIGFLKSAIAWSFGVTLLYGILGLIPILAFVYVQPLNPSEMGSFVSIIGSLLGIFFIGYFVKGALFGTILQFFCKKYLY